MISVSDDWKLAQRQLLVPESFIKIDYLITDPDVQSDITVNVIDEAYYSNSASIVNELDKPVDYITTIEDGLFLLDGNENYLNEELEYTKIGYVSNSICDDTGIFPTPIVIELQCSRVHTNIISGLTLTWASVYNEFPVHYTAEILNGNTVIHSEDITDNKEVNNILNFEYSNFDKIRITIYSWCLPNKRARMEEVIVGIYKTWTKKDLLSYTHTSSCDILSGSLPKNEITFDLDNSNLIWDMQNLTGNEKYLIEKQELKVKYGYDINGSIEWINVGKFYLHEWKTPANGIKVTFTARDLLTFMNDVYTGITTGTLYAICESALTQAELPSNSNGSVKWVLSDQLKEYTTTIPNDKTYTIAEILQLCSNAGMCVMYQDHDGIIRIEPQYLRLEDYVIDSFNSYEYPEFTTSRDLKAVNVNNNLGYIAVNDQGDIQTLNNALIQTPEHANAVAQWVANNLKFRHTISGKVRLDPRLEVTDLISVESRFNTLYAMAVTKVKETYNGAFRGEYEGRMYEFKPIEAGYLNDGTVSGDLW